VELLSLVQHRKETAHDCALFIGDGVKISLDASFNIVQDWKGMQDKAEECNRTKALYYTW
jgi:hypothetical protein